MKVSDLMVGDIVLYEYDGEQFKARVIEIYSNSVLVEEINGEYEPVEVEGVEPIPLTPEILEKNGFEYASNSNYYYDDYSGHIIRYNTWDKRLKIIRNLDVMFDSGDWADIKVHELQRALRLCNIDKEIEL